MLRENVICGDHLYEQRKLHYESVAGYVLQSSARSLQNPLKMISCNGPTISGLIVHHSGLIVHHTSVRLADAYAGGKHRKSDIANDSNRLQAFHP
jgi:hypothetical protein